MILYIKNMVCDRCKMVVEDIFSQNNILTKRVDLGVVETLTEMDINQTSIITQALQTVGFEILDDKLKQMVHIIKTSIIELVQIQPERLQKINPSVYISEKLGRDYKYLTTLFSDLEGTTIEQFLINQKVEKAKELLAYDEYNLSQIADLLYYSSVQHLSTQFKRVTGLTPSQFKKLKENNRISINKI